MALGVGSASALLAAGPGAASSSVRVQSADQRVVTPTSSGSNIQAPVAAPPGSAAGTAPTAAAAPTAPLAADAKSTPSLATNPGALASGSATVASAKATPALATTDAPLIATTAAYYHTPGVGRSGTSLTLNGVTHQFVGVDAYQLGTYWGVNAGCGGMYTDAQLASFFASLPPASLVRIWGFQGSIGTNATTHQLDWTPLDRVFSAAASHGQYIVLSLSDQAGTCDDSSWHGPDWYSGGYRNVVNPAGATPLSYWTYLQDAVAHFKGSSALAMWEPMNEAEASSCAAGYTGSNCFGHTTCSEASAESALRSFFDTVGGEIHALDPKHLVESGLASGGQCGSSYTDWTLIAQSKGIDVLSYHDYYPATSLIGGDQWNGEQLRFSQARSVGKPIIAGELGVLGYGRSTTSACPSLTDRSSDVVAKLSAQYAAGSAAELVWNADQGPTSACAYDVLPGDPLLTALAQF